MQYYVKCTEQVGSAVIFWICVSVGYQLARPEVFHSFRFLSIGSTMKFVIIVSFQILTCSPFTFVFLSHLVLHNLCNWKSCK
jgi:hypothetical protein